MPDLGGLQIRRVVVHEVPRRLAGDETVEPNLSETEPQLDSGLRNYFRERIAGSLRRAAFDVMFDPDSTSPISELVAKQLGKSGSGFVPASQTMARHLNAVQSGSNSGGLLVVALGRLGGHPSVAILKLEKEQGVRVREESVSGKHTLSIEHIRELMLTERTRVFKVGLFWSEGEIIGLVSDNQIPGTAVADFFLRKFLGCMLRMAADVQTKRFVDATERFINEEVTDPARKARYQIALLSEMSRGVGTIRPKPFAIEHLEVEDQDPYIDLLHQSDVPIRAFPKDLELVRSRVQRIRMDFESGVMLLGPPDVVESKVHIEARDGGRTHVEFEDTLRGVHGRR